jgi:putative inorganic carbon (HCO3(-)) transporter
VPGRGSASGWTATAAAATAAASEAAPQVEPSDWGYVGLLAFTAVLLLRPQDQVPGLGSMHVAEICALVGIGPMLIHRAAHGLPMFRHTPEEMGLIAFGLVMLATVPFSIWPGGALQEFTGSYLKVVAVFILMMNTLTTPRRLERLTWLILLCIGYIAALAIFNYARGNNLVEGGRLAGPVSGIFGNPNDLALNMVTFMPVAAIVAISRRHATWRRVAAAIIAALMMATVVFTQSRGGVLGLIVMLASLVVLGRRVRRGFGVIAVAAVLLATPLVPASFWTRMSSIVDEQQDKQNFTGSSEARRIVMLEGIEAFLEHPLTGVGAGQFKNYNPPERKERWRETHNALIQVAAETGIGGLLAFLFLIGRAATDAFSTRRMLRPSRKSEASDGRRFGQDDRRVLYEHTVAMTAGLIGWFTCAMFASVAYSWTFYYLLALIVAARELTRRRLTATRTIEESKATPARRIGRSRRLARGVAWKAALS